MFELLIKIVIISIVINGVYIVTLKDMVGYPFRKWLDEKLSVRIKIGEKPFCELGNIATDTNCKFVPVYETKYFWLHAPLIGCITCMASIWGTIIYWLLTLSLGAYLTAEVYVGWIVCCLGSAWLNPILFSIYDRITKTD